MLVTLLVIILYLPHSECLYCRITLYTLRWTNLLISSTVYATEDNAILSLPWSCFEFRLSSFTMPTPRSVKHHKPRIFSIINNFACKCRICQFYILWTTTTFFFFTIILLILILSISYNLFRLIKNIIYNALCFPWALIINWLLFVMSKKFDRWNTAYIILSAQWLILAKIDCCYIENSS